MTWTVGLDVSEWQGVIDWPAVAASGVEWAICRTGDGRYVDPTYVRNVEGAKAAGLKVGAYHFLRDSIAVGEMAQRIAAIVGRSDVELDLPWTLDYETTSGVHDPSRWIVDLAAEVERVSERPPIIYAGYYFAQGISIGRALERLPLWMPAYTRGYTPYEQPTGSWPDRALAAPPWAGIDGCWDAWTIWQFTSSAVVPGIAGGVDANLVTAANLADLCGDLAPSDLPDPPTVEDDTMPTHMLRLPTGAYVAAFASGVVRTIGTAEFRLFQSKGVEVFQVEDANEANQLVWQAHPFAIDVRRIAESLTIAAAPAPMAVHVAVPPNPFAPEIVK